MTTYTSTMRDAMRLAAEHRVDEAIERLEDALRVAREGDRSSATAATVTVSRAAAVLCEAHGRFSEAASYYQAAVAADPDDPCTWWALGDVYARLGDRALAQRHWDRFVELASASTDPDLQQLLDVHLARVRDIR